MGVDKSVEITPNAQKFISPSQKVWDFYKKGLHWASVVRGTNASLFSMKR